MNARRAIRWRAGGLGVALALLASAAAAADKELGALGIEWRAPMFVEMSGTPASADGRVFVVDGAISALAIATGARLWRSALGEFSPRCLTMAADRVIAAGETVVALDAATGAERWRHRLSAHAALACGAFAQGRFISGTSEGEVFALDAAGVLLWSERIGDPNGVRPALIRGVTIDQGIAYVAAEQWRTANGMQSSALVVAIDIGAGRRLWTTSYGGADERRSASAPPAVAADLIVVPDALGNSIFALDRDSGRIRWRFDGKRDAAGFPETPLVEGDRVYAASGDTHVYAIDRSTGVKLWQARLPASAGALARCGNRLVAVYQGLAAIEPQDGRVLQRLLDEEGDFIGSGMTVVDHRAALQHVGAGHSQGLNVVRISS